MSASAILKLQKAGFTTEQVEALAVSLDGQAASKADLKQETSALGADLKQETSALRADLKQETATLRADLRDEMSKLRNDTAKWIVGAVLVNVVTVQGGMLGMAKLLGH